MNCQFCNKHLNNKSNLTRHQQTAKKCLNIQLDKNDNIIIKKFDCQFCNKELSSKHSLDYHLKICKKIKSQIHNDVISKYQILNNINDVNTALNSDLYYKIELRKIELEKLKIESELEKVKIKTKENMILELLKDNNITFEQKYKLINL